MGQKRLKYILMMVVALIWGYVIYKYFIWSPEEAQGKAADTQLLPLPDDFAEGEDSFSLKLDYRDPFLSKTYSSRQPTARSVEEPQQMASTPKSVQPAPPNVPTIEWEAVAYHGLVRESGGGPALGLMRFKSRTHNIRPGDNIAGFDVLSFGRDSLVLGHEKERRTYFKQ
jgi:hypothetical protein